MTTADKPSGAVVAPTAALVAVQRSLARKRAAEQAYVAAVVAAHEAGAPAMKLAEAAGLSRQGLFTMLDRLGVDRPHEPRRTPRKPRTP